jgi:hypothetical protein
MHRHASPVPLDCIETSKNPEARERIAGVNLLGVAVTAVAIIQAAEDERRRLAGIGAITDPALLDRLLELPLGAAVSDPVAWAETADQPAGVIGRESDGITVTRHLAAPLSIEDVIVAASAGRELRAVQDASLFAGFARRWVALARHRLPEPALLEAKLCGVGLLDSSGRMVLTSDDPSPSKDGWAWMLQEKAYRWWLSRQSRNHATASQAPATGAATGEWPG